MAQQVKKMAYLKGKLPVTLGDIQGNHLYKY